ncbi:hypothetical protein GEMRC1_000565 [Eukaryota sp. GEM-RC1]
MSVDFSNVLISAGDSLKLWTPPKDIPFFHHPSPTFFIDFHPDKEHYVTANNEQSCINIFHKNIKLNSIVTPEPVRGLSFSSTGFAFASIHSTLVTIYQWATITPLSSFPLPSPPNDVSFCRNGNLLAVGCENGQVLINDIHTGKNKLKFADSLRRSVTKVQFNPVNSAFLCAGFSSGNIIVYNINKEAIHHTFYAVHRKSIKSLAFSPKNVNLLASVGHDSKIRFLDYRSAKKVVMEISVPANISCVVFHPSGQGIAVGDSHGNISVFDLRVVGKFKNEHGHETPLHHWSTAQGSINQLIWLPTSQWITVNESPVRVRRSPKKTLASPMIGSPMVGSPRRPPPSPPSPVKPPSIDQREKRKVVERNDDDAVLQVKTRVVEQLNNVADFEVRMNKPVDVSTKSASPIVTRPVAQPVQSVSRDSDPPRDSDPELTIKLMDMMDQLRSDVHQSVSGLHVELIKQVVSQNQLFKETIQEQQEKIEALSAEVSVLCDLFKQQFGSKLSTLDKYLTEDSII